MVGHAGGGGLAVRAGCFFTEPFKEVGGVLDFVSRLGQSLAVFPGDQLREVIGVFDHEVVPFTQEAGAFASSGLTE